MTIFESDFLLVTLDEENKIMMEEWKHSFNNIPKNEIFKEPLEKLIQATQENGIGKWLMDNTEASTVSDDDQIWIEDFYLPALVKAGINTVALVNAKKVLRNNIVKNVLETSSNDMKIEVFNKNEEAKEWLKNA